jgi:hypothetical protein
MKSIPNIALLAMMGSLVLGSVSQAEALSLSFSDALPLRSTNWNQSVSIPRFNPSLGTLTSVELDLQASINSHVRVESLDQ